MIGIEEDKFKQEYVQCVNLVNEKNYIFELQKISSIASQWNKLMKHPLLKEQYIKEKSGENESYG